MIDLKKFTDSRDHRDICKKPFSYNGFSFGTNGYVMAVLPGEHHCETQFDESWGKELPRIYTLLISAVANRVMPPLGSVVLPEKITCPMCKGQKIGASVECKECDGWGEVTASTDYNDYEGLECRSCHGAGETFSVSADYNCLLCDSTGLSYPDNPILIDGIRINPKYAELIVHEPNIQVFGDMAGQRLFFKTAEAFGLIMGIRE
jgi:hypothetical protein